MADDTNEFGLTPDSPEIYQAAAAMDPLAEVPPAAPTDDIESELPAAEVPPEAPAPVAPVAAAPVAAPVDKVAEARSKIHGLHEEEGALGLEGVALETKRILAAQPKVRMMIPLDPGERAGAYRTVIINGYRFDVKKNVMVDLPEAVASLLADSYRITSEVLEDNPLNLANADAGRRAALGL